MNDEQLLRYSRHILLDEIGVEAQQHLLDATALVVGAGGLGSPAGLYLAAAGIGRILLADDDTVDLTNLQRQILHAEGRIGVAKVDSAEQSLRTLNPRTRVESIPVHVTAANAGELLAEMDVVVDGSDNFATRYVLNDACVRLRKPLVYGAVQRFEGQVSVFDAGRRPGSAPCYRCLYPEPPAPGSVPNCAEAGVLGVLPGVIGLLQATEAIKLILGIGLPLVGRLLQFDALTMQFRELQVSADPRCPVCAAHCA